MRIIVLGWLIFGAVTLPSQSLLQYSYEPVAPLFDTSFPRNPNINSLNIHSSGDVLISGNYGNRACFVMKLSSSGVPLWGRYLTGSNTEFETAFHPDGSIRAWTNSGLFLRIAANGDFISASKNPQYFPWENSIKYIHPDTLLIHSGFYLYLYAANGDRFFKKWSLQELIEKAYPSSDGGILITQNLPSNTWGLAKFKKDGSLAWSKLMPGSSNTAYLREDLYGNILLGRNRSQITKISPDGTSVFWLKDWHVANMALDLEVFQVSSDNCIFALYNYWNLPFQAVEPPSGYLLLKLDPDGNALSATRRAFNSTDTSFAASMKQLTDSTMLVVVSHINSNNNTPHFLFDFDRVNSDGSITGGCETENLTASLQLFTDTSMPVSPIPVNFTLQPGNTLPDTTASLDPFPFFFRDCSGAPLNENPMEAQLYPNPNPGSFNLVLNYTGPYGVRIFDLTGRLLYINAFENLPIATFNIPGLSEGIYFLNVSFSDGMQHSLKFITQTD